MKTGLAVVLVFLLGNTVVTAQEIVPKKRDSLPSILQRRADEARKRNLKSYYEDPETAQQCESWRSCSHWAFFQYTDDQSFKVLKTLLKTHYQKRGKQTIKKESLFVQALIKGQTVNLQFTTPKYDKNQQAYRVIKSFPRN